MITVRFWDASSITFLGIQLLHTSLVWHPCTGYIVAIQLGKWGHLGIHGLCDHFAYRRIPFYFLQWNICIQPWLLAVELHISLKCLETSCLYCTLLATVGFFTIHFFAVGLFLYFTLVNPPRVRAGSIIATRLWDGPLATLNRFYTRTLPTFSTEIKLNIKVPLK